MIKRTHLPPLGDFTYKVRGPFELTQPGYLKKKMLRYNKTNPFGRSVRTRGLFMNNVIGSYQLRFSHCEP